jgi:hypothetical protein
MLAVLVRTFGAAQYVSFTSTAEHNTDLWARNPSAYDLPAQRAGVPETLAIVSIDAPARLIRPNLYASRTVGSGRKSLPSVLSK